MGMLQAWSPMFYDKLNDKKYDDINSLTKKYTKIVLIIAFTLILFARELVMLMADKKYYVALNIVPVVIISYLFFFLYTMYVSFAFYYKKTQLIALITIIAGSVNIVLNYLFIPKFGYTIAAWTTLISYVVLFVLHYVNVKFKIKPVWLTNLKIFLPPLLIFFLFVTTFAFLTGTLHNYFILLISKIILLCFMALLFFKTYIRI